VVPDLHIGHYMVKVEAGGFKTTEQKDVVLNVGDRTRLDFQLQLRSATDTATVEADAVRVQTDSGEISSVITGRQIAQLATNGRDIYSLAILLPGASSQMSDFQVATPVAETRASALTVCVKHTISICSTVAKTTTAAAGEE